MIGGLQAVVQVCCCWFGMTCVIAPAGTINQLPSHPLIRLFSCLPLPLHTNGLTGAVIPAVKNSRLPIKDLIFTRPQQEETEKDTWHWVLFC
jgi:hypothetical protein